MVSRVPADRIISRSNPVTTSEFKPEIQIRIAAAVFCGTTFIAGACFRLGVMPVWRTSGSVFEDPLASMIVGGVILIGVISFIAADDALKTVGRARLSQGKSAINARDFIVGQVLGITSIILGMTLAKKYLW